MFYWENEDGTEGELFDRNGYFYGEDLYAIGFNSTPVIVCIDTLDDNKEVFRLDVTDVLMRVTKAMCREYDMEPYEPWEWAWGTDKPLGWIEMTLEYAKGKVGERLVGHYKDAGYGERLEQACLDIHNTWSPALMKYVLAKYDPEHESYVR